ncbi:Dimer_Tnp_hAT domain-containing protein, partial [Cephalotus follicularis]
SSKRRDQLQDKHAERVFKVLKNNSLVTGKGLNQEIGLKCLGDTRWGSHYVIDMQLLELNDHFTEVNTKLLLCMTCLNLINHFLAFNTEDLVSFVKFYPNDFYTSDLIELKNQLETYIIDMSSDIEFTEVNGVGELAKRMKEKNKDKVYPLVYMLLKLVLILPVSTVTVEKAFSTMIIIKNRLRNRMGDQWMNDIL